MQEAKHKDKAIEIKNAKSTWSVLSPANGAYSTPENIDSARGWDELDKAVRYTFVGRYKDAKKIFNPEFISDEPHKYVEACVLYRTIGEWRTFVKDVPPLVPPTHTGPKSTSADIWSLIALQSYHADTTANGTLRQASKYVKNFYLHYLRKNIKDYTGIDVQCLLECHRITLVRKETSNWTFHAKLPSLTEVRVHLQNKKLYSEAQSLLQTEVLVQKYDGSSQVNPYESFLEATAHLDLCNDEATLIKMSQVRLDYAEQLVGLEKYDDARAELLKARELMSRAAKPRLTGYKSMIKERSSLIFPTQGMLPAIELQGRYPKMVYQYHKCFILSQGNIEIEWQKHLNKILIDSAMESGDMLQYRSCLLTEYDLSLPKNAVDRVSQKTDEFRLIGNKIIDLDENDLHLAYYRCDFLNRYATDCGNQPREELEEILELFKKFEKEHPKFELPSKCRSMAVRCAQLNHAIGNEEGEDLHFAKVEFWTRHSLRTKNKEKLDTETLKDMFNLELFGVPFESRRAWYHFMLWCCYLIIKWTEVTMQSTIHPIPNINRLLYMNEDSLKDNDQPWWECSDFTPLLEDSSPVYSNDDVSLILPTTLMERAFGRQNPQTPQNWDAWLEVLQTVLSKKINKRHRIILLVITQMCRVWKIVSHSDQIPPDGKGAFNTLLFKECEVVLRLTKDMTQRNFDDSFALGKAMSMTARATIRMVMTSDEIDGENKSGSPLSRAVDHFYLSSQSFNQDVKLFAPTLDIYAITLGLAYAEWGKQRNSNSFNASVVLSYFTDADLTYQRYRLSRILWMENEDIKTSNFNAIHCLPTPEQYSDLAVMITTRGLLRLCPTSDDELVKLTDDATIFSAKELIEEAIKWTQKVKTRPLEKLLRNYVDLPGYILSRLSNNAKIQREWNIRKHFWNSDPTHLLGPRLSFQLREFYNHETTLKNMLPDLSPYLSLYEASRANPKELRRFMESWGPSVVMLIYIEVRGPEYDWLVFMYRQTQLFCIAPIRTLKIHQLEVYLDTVDTELRASGGGTKRDTERQNILCPLVEPLQEWIKPTDSLIICPSPSLYRVPFQLLYFPSQAPRGDVPLFKNHSITYAQTFSLLNICQLSQQNKFDCSAEGANIAVEKPLYSKENSAHMTCRNITVKSSEMNRNKGSCSIYIYGQELERPQDRVSITDEFMPLDIGYLRFDKVPATELLKLRFAYRPNILFLTRESPRYERNDDSDHMTRIAALHISGAGSIISTLRVVPQEYCERFLSSFHMILIDTIKDSIGNAEMVYIGDSPEYVNDDWVATCFIDLAQVLQRTIISLIEQCRDEQNSTGVWTAFVLHGAHKIGLLKKSCT